MISRFPPLHKKCPTNYTFVLVTARTSIYFQVPPIDYVRSDCIDFKLTPTLPLYQISGIEINYVISTYHQQ